MASSVLVRRLGARAATLTCTLLVLGFLLPTTGAAGLDRRASRRALLQVPAAVTGPPPGAPNATDLAVESLNSTGTQAALAANRTALATIFAPTDAAFAALATSLNLSSPLDLFNATYNATAANITALHVIPGEALTSANLTAGANITAPSLLGYNLTVAKLLNGTVTVTVPGSAIVGTVLTPDVPYNGSIVHIIDKVLLPPANETTSWAIPLTAAPSAP
ncbi:hypothetical protein Agub_g9611 [Astrephomene gubernaculifera]|uniref:FAS1 domain-containing protein n=1 Tax=Astrephomene gubernaculifera TaxID=47775 RepID=A0AAD3DU13_9CHLO|nr:hypothetical protein Agub_g9611 [Astrephomene gubernaculifera]